MRLRTRLAPALAVLGWLATPGGAAAETDEIRMARQYGIAFLPFIEMEQKGLIEKHARDAGLANLKVSWNVLSGSAGMNDALLSGNLSFGAGALPSLLLLWDRTKASSNPVRGISSLTSMPVDLNTRNPNVHSIRDLTDKDKIALPSVKLSMAALVLEMAAAREWGDAAYARLDPLTVSAAHPDAVAALLSDSHEINAHFASPPYQYLELKDPRIHTILGSYDVIGDASLTVMWATRNFVEANPRATAAVYAALREAIETINADKPEAARLYLKATKERMSFEDLLAVLENPRIIYTAAPQGTAVFAGFMRKTKVLQAEPASWRDIFFPIAADLPGN